MGKRRRPLRPNLKRQRRAQYQPGVKSGSPRRPDEAPGSDPRIPSAVSASHGLRAVNLSKLWKIQQPTQNKGEINSTSMAKQFHAIC